MPAPDPRLLDAAPVNGNGDVLGGVGGTALLTDGGGETGVLALEGNGAPDVFGGGRAALVLAMGYGAELAAGLEEEGAADEVGAELGAGDDAAVESTMETGSMILETIASVEEA